MELSFAEGRVLGCLVEKQLLTPQAYPLTDNALVAACNQTTSREPVVRFDVPTVRLAVRSLRENGLVRTTHRTGERADKHEHKLADALGLSPAEVALLAVLLLRGPQTPGELRARTDRMHAFASPEEVEQVLDGLAARAEPLVTRLERQPGRKEARYAAAVVTGAPEPAAGAAPAWLPAAPAAAAAPDPGGSAPAPADLVREVAELRDEVAELRDEVAALRAEVAALRGAASATTGEIA